MAWGVSPTSNPSSGLMLSLSRIGVGVTAVLLLSKLGVWKPPPAGVRSAKKSERIVLIKCLTYSYKQSRILHGEKKKV
jgi:hypothetical protein